MNSVPGSLLHGEELRSVSDRLQGLALATPEAELHGLVCGVVCAETDASLDIRANLLLELLDVAVGDRAGLVRDIVCLIESCRCELGRLECDFQPVLPDEDAASLAERAEALGQWCQGFLSGYGASQAGGSTEDDEEVTSALKDLVAISQVDFDVDESEDEEWHYFRVKEYVRMAVLSIFMDRAGVDAGAAPAPEGRH